MAAFLRLLHLEAEAVALIAEIDRRLVHQMAVYAVELILIVRRDMRICRFDVFCFLDDSLDVVTGLAGIDCGFLRIGFIRPMTHFALHAFGDVAFGACGGIAGRSGSADKDCGQNGKFG